MNDRDHFAAAALTGLIASRQWPIDFAEAAHYCYRLADAMLAARADTTAHDAAPAATASDTENQAVGRRAETSAGAAGTGDTRAAQEPVGWAAYESESDAEPIVLCFKESRARANVRGVAGSRVVPLYAAPPHTSATLTDAEREAIDWGAHALYGRSMHAEAATLRGLLARAAKEGSRD